MTYSILFKYFISNEQIKNFSKSYLNSMSLENQNDNSDENIKIGKNEKCAVQVVLLKHKKTKFH